MWRGITIAIRALETVYANLEKRLAIRTEIILTTALLKSLRKLQRVLETWGDLRSARFQWKKTSPVITCPVGWRWRIHRQIFCRGVRPLLQRVAYIWHKTIWRWGSSIAGTFGNAEYPYIIHTLQVKWARHAGHSWWRKDECISDILLWTPWHGHTSVNQPAKTYIHQLCVDISCCLGALYWHCG